MSADHVKRICRVCLAADVDVLNIFSHSTKFDDFIFNILSLCASVHVKLNDGISPFICSPCLTQLEAFFEFRMLVQNSHKILQESSKNIQVSNFDSAVRCSGNDLKFSQDLCAILMEQSCQLSQNSKKNEAVPMFLQSYTEIQNQSDTKPFLIDGTTDHQNNSQDTNSPDQETNEDIKVEEDTNFGYDTDRSSAKHSDWTPCQIETDASEECKIKQNKSKLKFINCNICNKKFRNNDLFFKHKQTHDGYQCEKCGKQFTVRSSYKSHMLNHEDARPFGCDKCEKHFASKLLLKYHKRTHSTKKPYLCGVCGKSFSKLNYLTTHQTSHTDERPHECDICKKKYKTLYTLGVHKRIHSGYSPFKCDFCDKTFNQSANLTVHTRTHTNERPYACDICPKRFKTSTHLAGHKRSHTGEERFQCDACLKRFTAQKGLKKHKMFHCKIAK